MKKRQLSEFMTHELLYDYIMDKLDAERKASVEEVLRQSREAQEELRSIEHGIQYLEKLSLTKISISLAQEVSQRATYLDKVQKTLKYENWPPFLKWTLEAVLVISVVIIVSLVAPWEKLKDFVMQRKTTELVLAEVSKTQTPREVTKGMSPSVVDNEAHFEDESTDDETDIENTSQARDKKTEKSQMPSHTESKPKQTKTAAASERVEESKRKGFVYRGTLEIVNVEAGTAKLKEKIVELGGRKAGEVELGWRRNDGDYYFHFTIPESKLDTLQEYFKSLGTIKLSKDPHPRIMPDGIVRLIITTEEAK